MAKKESTETLLEDIANRAQRLRYRSVVLYSLIIAFVGVFLGAAVAVALRGKSLLELHSLLNELGTHMLANAHFMIPAAIGLLILAYEAEARNRLTKSELELNREKFRAERQDRIEQKEFLENESQNLRGLTKKIAENITAQLINDTHWASDALIRAKLGPHSNSLFGERSGHFYDEKNTIAEQFVDHLLRRCQDFIEQGSSEAPHSVYLLIDSGTTLAPFFSILGEKGIRFRENGEDWIDRLTIVTNNLPGIEALISVSRRNPNNRFSDLAVSCFLLPGEPLPVYAAVTGKDTVEAIDALGKGKSKEHTRFIGLVTGNWVWLQSDPACPIPLARGRGHGEIKEALIRRCDETYVISPLGKLLVDMKSSSDKRDPYSRSLEDFNLALGYKEGNRDPDKKPYRAVHVEQAKISTLRLVSTFRESGNVLSSLSTKALLEIRYDAERDYRRFIEAEGPSSFCHVIVPFRKLPKNWNDQLIVEFPHPVTRWPKIRERFFFVPEVPSEGFREPD